MWRREPAVQQLITHLDQYTFRKDWPFLSREERCDLLTKAEWDAVVEQQTMCSSDFTWAARNYFWITDNNGQDVLLNLWEAQYLILQLWHDLKSQGKPQKVYIIKGRQIGASVLVEAMIAWAAIFFPNTEALVVSVDHDHSAYVFGLMLHIYDHLPWWLKPELASREEQNQLWFDRLDPDQRAISPGLNSHVYVQWSTQMSGVGQGRKILALHATELTDWHQPAARRIVEGDLGHAIKDTPRAFGFLETTGKEAGSYCHRLWKRCEALAELSDWYPLFLPWFFEPSRRRVVPVNGWKPARQESTMRERVRREWVKCPSCGRYNTGALKGVTRVGSTCIFCKQGNYESVILSDEQLFWKEVKRRNAEGTDSESYKEHLIELACVAHESRVSTEYGILPIGDRGNVGSDTESGPLIRWIDSGQHPTLRVATKLGRELICTLNQMFRMSDMRWQRADELTSGDELLLCPPRFAADYHTERWFDPPIQQHQIFVDERVGRMLGYFMGDGCWKKSEVSISVDRKDQDIVEDIRNLLASLVGQEPRIEHHAKHQMTEVDSTSVKWFPIMRQLGAIERWHENSWGWKRKVCVPECIWRSPRSVVREFLSALFECDAHAYKETPLTVLFTMHEQFARDVQLLLLGFGVNAEIQESKKVNGEGREYVGRRVIARGEGSNRFHETIGFISARKRNTACRRGPSKMGTRSKYRPNYDQVLSVSPDGVRHVYDLQMPPPHQFSANGLAIHNTTAEEAFQLQGKAVFDSLCQEAVNATILDPDKVAGIKRGYYDTSQRFHGLDGEYPVWNGFEQTGDPDTFRCYLKECQYDHKSDFEHFNVTIWEEPIAGREYSIGVDIAEGIGEDYSVIFVNKFGIHGAPDEQVATLRDNRMEPLDLAFYCNLLGRKYNDALMCIEYNGIGKICADAVLRVYNYPNVYQWKHPDSVSVRSNKWHWYTNSNTREKLWQTARKWIKAGAWVIRSKNFMAEMLDFQKDEDDSKSASHADGSHDDELFAGFISLYCGHECESDSRGVIQVPIVEDKISNPRWLMHCNACENEWGAHNPEAQYRCPRCHSVNLTGKNLESTDSHVRQLSDAQWDSVNLPPTVDWDAMLRSNDL